MLSEVLQVINYLRRKNKSEIFECHPPHFLFKNNQWFDSITCIPVKTNDLLFAKI